ncbi:hypothetical protein THAOC_18108, partial [Thalassiosira oceanica]
GGKDPLASPGVARQPDRAGDDLVQRRADHRQRIVRRGLPGERRRDGGDSGHQEGTAGQAVQESGAADHEAAGPRRAFEHSRAEALLLQSGEFSFDSGRELRLTAASLFAVSLRIFLPKASPRTEFDAIPRMRLPLTGCVCFYFNLLGLVLTFNLSSRKCPGREAGGTLPEPRPRVRPRDGILYIPPSPEVEDTASPALRQTLHVPTIACPVPHPLPRDMSPRHQAAEPPRQPREPAAQALRLRERQGPRPGRAQRQLHLQQVLQGARAHLRQHRLLHEHRRLERGVRRRRAPARPAPLPRRLGRRPARRDHQGPRHPHEGGDMQHELELHRVQIPADQGLPVEEGFPVEDARGRHGLHSEHARVRSGEEGPSARGVRPRLLRRAQGRADEAPERQRPPPLFDFTGHELASSPELLAKAEGGQGAVFANRLGFNCWGGQKVSASDAEVLYYEQWQKVSLRVSELRAGRDRESRVAESPQNSDGPPPAVRRRRARRDRRRPPPPPLGAVRSPVVRRRRRRRRAGALHLLRPLGTLLHPSPRGRRPGPPRGHPPVPRRDDDGTPGRPARRRRRHARLRPAGRARGRRGGEAVPPPEPEQHRAVERVRALPQVRHEGQPRDAGVHRVQVAGPREGDAVRRAEHRGARPHRAGGQPVRPGRRGGADPRTEPGRRGRPTAGRAGGAEEVQGRGPRGEAGRRGGQVRQDLRGGGDTHHGRPGLGHGVRHGGGRPGPGRGRGGRGERRDGEQGRHVRAGDGREGARGAGVRRRRVVQVHQALPAEQQGPARERRDGGGTGGCTTLRFADTLSWSASGAGDGDDGGKNDGLGEHVVDLPGSVTIENPPVDFTPAKYITLLFTDLGVLTPSAVSDELIRLYQ